jgi:hypothetical protein
LPSTRGRCTSSGTAEVQRVEVSIGDRHRATHLTKRRVPFRGTTERRDRLPERESLCESPFHPIARARDRFPAESHPHLCCEPQVHAGHARSWARRNFRFGAVVQGSTDRMRDTPPS